MNKEQDVISDLIPPSPGCNSSANSRRKLTDRKRKRVNFSVPFRNRKVGEVEVEKRLNYNESRNSAIPGITDQLPENPGSLTDPGNLPCSGSSKTFPNLFGISSFKTIKKISDENKDSLCDIQRSKIALKNPYTKFDAKHETSATKPNRLKSDLCETSCSNPNRLLADEVNTTVENAKDRKSRKSSKLDDLTSPIICKQSDRQVFMDSLQQSTSPIISSHVSRKPAVRPVQLLFPDDEDSQGSSEEDLEGPKNKPLQDNSTRNSNSIQKPDTSQTINHQKENLSKPDLQSNNKNVAKAKDDLNIAERLDLNDHNEKGSSVLELSAIKEAANEIELSAVVDDDGISKIQNKDSSLLELSAIEKANDVHHASEEEELTEDLITADNGEEVRSNNTSVDWSVLMSRSGENSLLEDAPETPALKMAASLGCTGTPLPWDTKFETPVLGQGGQAGAEVPVDSVGRMTWNQMNSVERLHLLPSNNEGDLEKKHSRPPSRNLFPKGSNASNKDTHDTESDDDATEDTILLEELELDTNSQGESVKHGAMEDYCASPIIRINSVSNGRLLTKPFKSTSTKEKETPNDIINRNKVDENETSSMNTNSATELTKDDINELSASILDEVLEDWDDKDALAGVNPNGLIRADTEPVSSSTPVPKLAGSRLKMLKGATHKFKENPLGKTIKYSFDLSSEKVKSSTPKQVKPSKKDNIQSMNNSLTSNGSPSILDKITLTDGINSSTPFQAKHEALDGSNNVTPSNTQSLHQTYILKTCTPIQSNPKTLDTSGRITDTDTPTSVNRISYGDRINSSTPIQAKLYDKINDLEVDSNGVTPISVLRSKLTKEIVSSTPASARPLDKDDIEALDDDLDFTEDFDLDDHASDLNVDTPSSHREKMESIVAIFPSKYQGKGCLVPVTVRNSDLEIQNLDAILEPGRQDQEQGSEDTKCKPLETNKQIRPNFCGNKRFLGVGGRRSVGNCLVKSAPGSTPTIQFSSLRKVLKSEESTTPKNLKALNANKLNFNPREFPSPTTANILLNSTEDKQNLSKSWTNKENSCLFNAHKTADNSLNDHFQTDSNPAIENFVGFATASGTKVNISKEALEKAKKTLAGNAGEKSIKENSENPGFPGFATAAGIKANISKEVLLKAKKTLAVKTSEEPAKDFTENPGSLVFNTGSEKPETIDDSKENIAAAVKSSGDNAIVDKYIKLDSACLGFTTASGNKVNISDKDLSEAKKRFAAHSDDSTSHSSGNESQIPVLRSKSNGSLKTVSSPLISQANSQSHSTSTIIQGIKQLTTQRKLTTTSTGVIGTSEIKVKVSERADLESKRNLKDSTDFNLENEILAIDDKRDSKEFLSFTTALGNKVHISEKAIHHAKSMLGFRAENQESEEEQFGDKTVNRVKPFEEMKDFIGIDTTETTYVGFMTAGGNKVDISEKAMKEAKQKMNIDSEINDASKTGFTGFMTSGGKKVDISEKAIKEAKQKLNIDAERNEPNKTIYMGFLTASGKKVDISEEALNQAKQKIDVATEFNGPFKTGFMTAGGKKVDISEETLNQAKQKMEVGTKKNDHSKTSFTGFMTAGGNKVDISEKAMKEAKHKMNIVNEDSGSLKTGFTGFKTAGGKKVDISEKAMKQAQQKMGTPSNKENENVAAFSGFMTAGGSKVEISEKALLHAKNKLGLTSELSPSSSNGCNNENICKNVVGFTSASGKSVSISETALKHAKYRFDSNSSESKQSNAFVKSMNAKSSNTFANTNTNSEVKTVTADDGDELDNMEFSFDDNLNFKDAKDQNKGCPLEESGYPGNLEEPGSPVLTSKKRKQNFDSQTQSKKVKIQEFDDKADEIVSELSKYRAKQKLLIEQKSKTTIRPIPGHLYNLKRARRQELVPLNSAETQTYDPSQLSLGLSADTSLDVRFDVAEQRADENKILEDENQILRLEDGAWIVPGNDGCIGIGEIEQSFLAMPGVDPKLIHHKWITNHYKMIVWSLASIERKGLAESALNVQNVMARLKYRYDREIDSAERSILRRICEKDDASTRSMILLVSSISNDTIQLSDGWYSLPVKVLPGDPLELQISVGRIQPGTKLICQNMNLVGASDGFHPLDATGSEFLQLTVNSCRRAAWWARLGPCRPLTVSVGSLITGGGGAGVLKVWVTRVYPVLYMAKINDKVEYLSEKEWRKRVEKSRQESNRKLVVQSTKNTHKRRSIKEVKSLDSGEDLVGVLEDDPSIWEILSSTQRETATNHKQEIMLSARMAKRTDNSDIESARPVLRVRICDIISTREMAAPSQIKSGLVSVWNPGSLADVLLEGRALAVSGLQVKRISEGTVHLTTVKSTQFLDLACTKCLPTQFQRKITELRDLHNPDLYPVFREVDCVGYIIQLNPVKNGFADIQICDTSAVIRVRVWQGVEAAGLSATLEAGNYVSFRNLDWREDRIPGLYLNQATIVTTNPRLQNHIKAIQSLQDFVSSSEDLVQDYQTEFDELVASAARTRHRSSVSTPLQAGKSTLTSVSTPLLEAGTPLQAYRGLESRRGQGAGTPSLKASSSGWNLDAISECQESRQVRGTNQRISQLDAYTSQVARMTSSPATPQGHSRGLPMRSTYNTPSSVNHPSNLPIVSGSDSALTPHIRGKSVLSIPYRPPRMAQDLSTAPVEVPALKSGKRKADTDEPANFGSVEPSLESQELEQVFSDLMDELNV